jgi:DNA-binding transcriptional regulator YiaG
MAMAKLSRFGAEMREWRKRNLLSQMKFAMALGVPETFRRKLFKQ